MKIRQPSLLNCLLKKSNGQACLSSRFSASHNKRGNILGFQIRPPLQGSHSNPTPMCRNYSHLFKALLYLDAINLTITKLPSRPGKHPTPQLVFCYMHCTPSIFFFFFFNFENVQLPVATRAIHGALVYVNVNIWI